MVKQRPSSPQVRCPPSQGKFSGERTPDRGLVVALTPVGAGAVVHMPSIGAVDRSLVLAHDGTTLLALDAQIRDQKVSHLSRTQRGCSNCLGTQSSKRSPSSFHRCCGT